MSQLATVTPINPALRAPRASTRPIPRAVRKLRQQAMAGLAICAVALTLLGLSLTHLAHGIAIVTHAPDWEAWAMAIGIDIGFVALECAQLTAATEKLRRDIARFTKPGIVGTLT